MDHFIVDLLVPLWSDNIFHIMSVPLNLLRLFEGVYWCMVSMYLERCCVLHLLGELFSKYIVG